jgi:hypothetical protein
MHMMLAQVMQILSLPPVGVEERGDVQEGFRLDQNYPNPWNPRTVIRYSVRNESWVRLAVYDLLGREVAVLVDGPASPGDHTIPFDGTGLAGGIYLYRLASGGASRTRGMVLLR